MNLDQLLHVLRAACDISGEKSFVLVGSQAVLLALPDPDAMLTRSDEIDLYPSMAPEKADAIDGAIGALSRFHDEFGFSTLFRGGHIDLATLTERIRQIDAAQYPVEHIVMWAARRHREATEAHP
jgi:hypothetical protein